MQMQLSSLNAELSSLDKAFIAECLGISDMSDIENTKLKPYRKALISYCMSFKQKGLFLYASDIVREKLVLFINAYAANWLPEEDKEYSAYK